MLVFTAYQRLMKLWVSWFRVSWLGVGRCRVSGVLGFSFVFQFSDVSILVRFVGDDLSAAVGENDAVRAGGEFAVTVGRVRVVVV